jgi:hypothetical protein
MPEHTIINGVGIVARFAQNIPIIAIPEQRLITFVRLLMMHLCGSRDYPATKTLTAQRVSRKKRFSQLPPPWSVVPGSPLRRHLILTPSPYSQSGELLRYMATLRIDPVAAIIASFAPPSARLKVSGATIAAVTALAAPPIAALTRPLSHFFILILTKPK